MKSGSRILVLFLLFTLFVQCFACGDHCLDTANNKSVVLNRPKRYLDFIRASRMFFRANIKQTVLPWSTIWAFAQGWKANMNFLNSNKALRPVYFRRDTYEVLQELLDFHGLDGQACMLKAFCTATRSPDGAMAGGMLFKLVRHIFKLDEHDRSHFDYLKEENCEEIIHHQCPLSFNNISPYTDDV